MITHEIIATNYFVHHLNPGDSWNPSSVNQEKEISNYIILACWRHFEVLKIAPITDSSVEGF